LRRGPLRHRHRARRRRRHERALRLTARQRLGTGCTARATILALSCRVSPMSASVDREVAPEPGERTRPRFANPYLLLAAAALFWSGNHIVGRAIGGHVPPIGVSTIRW